MVAVAKLTLLSVTGASVISVAMATSVLSYDRLANAETVSCM